MKSMIVDDEKISRKLLATYLSNYGKCIMAADGEEAIYHFKQALIEKQPFDLVCMDIMMPIINGHRALKEIRYLERQYEVPKQSHVKVFMTTSLEDSDSANEAYYMGHADSYLVKPVDIKLLHNELIRHQLVQ